MGATRDKPRINKTLISLKAVVFFVISGITALHVLHATKPLLLGLNFNEYRRISIIAPFVSILGPLIAGPLADRLAAKNATSFGRILRFLTAIFLILAVIVYACLFAIPEVKREEARRPLVSFGCDLHGAVIFQERCSKDATCHSWKEKVGNVNLTRCTYTCQDPTKYENLYTPWFDGIPTPLPSTEQSSEFDYEDESVATSTESLRERRAIAGSAEFGGELLSAEVQQQQQQHQRVERAVKDGTPQKIYVEPPHLCLTEKTDSGETVVKNCHVYTHDTNNIVVNSVLRAADNSKDNDTHSAEWCKYPLDGFQCNIPLKQIKHMNDIKNGTTCKPMIECQVIDPYDSKGSVLADSECIKITGDLDATLGGYTAIRLLGDIFVMAALTLLNTAIVIAVRETSEGRGEVCRQYAWGAIGYVLLFSPIDLFAFANDSKHDAALVALILVIVCLLIGALVLLFATQMPLSPPEWWWHTKTGMLVYPMSAIRRYSPEIFVLTLVAILFGTFWSSIHSFLIWTFSDTYAVTYSGLILVLVLFFNVDKFIEYCGHSNIFIAGFAVFVIRFTALSGEGTEWLTVVMEAIEPVVIGVVWITIILYMRHAMPRKLTATGQAVAVLAFFGIGKGLGAVIGLARDDKEPKADAQAIHQWLAIAACIIALVYFIIYNLILAPRCTAKSQHIEELISGSASQNFSNGTNGAGSTGQGSTSAGAALNGSSNYSPLRVYHNERGKLGQFRF
uniref:Major facilitator superfamily domain-containing protein 6-A n=1 Tax=Bactrocera latifrons TaxID=174628 RepID=A0A0K8UL94_BACLA